MTPEAIDRQSVHDALESLYDSVRLGQAGLIGRFAGVAGIGPLDERGAAMRSVLLEAIEALRPPRRAAFGSLESRTYDVLTLRYVEGLAIERVESELCVGRRQIYRDLEEAEGKLADVLSSWTQVSSDVAAGRHGPDSLSDELVALSGDPMQVDMRQVLSEALSVVSPLAQLASVSLPEPDPAEPVCVLADRSILRQVVVQLLSVAVQAAASPITTELIQPDEGSAGVRISFTGSLSVEQRNRLRHTQRIAASQGHSCSWEAESGHVQVFLTVATGSAVTVLLVEDNPGAVELYRRYLSSSGWQLRSVPDPRLAGEMARRIRPEIIVLDVMMPRLDGWSVLQGLRADQATRDIPVVICSIVDDPELAAALGAQESITKPVSQGEFLAALRRCLAR